MIASLLRCAPQGRYSGEMRPQWLLVVAACSCGRSGFGVVPDSAVVIDPFDAPPGSTVVTFGETPTATFKGVTQDTYLTNDTSLVSTFNYGASTRLFVEGTQARALVRFDVASLPASAQLVSARLRVTLTSLEISTTVTVLPIREAWTEGSQNGAAGAANYTQRTATQSWTTAGAGAGSTGASIASASTTATGSLGVDLPIATIQSWRDASSTNFGIALGASGGDFSISSSNDTPAANRPQLIVTYFP
jgi:hypothetical protein